jgi:hypothetical protein
LLKTYEIILDVEKELYNPSNLSFSISQNDLESIELTFLIRQDENDLNLTGNTVELAVKKPSGLTIYHECDITDATGGEAKILLDNQAYLEYGVHTAELYIRNVDQLAVTCPFWYMSRSAIMDDQTIESSNEWSALQQALFAYDLKPILTEGFPTAIPEYIGQMAFDSVNRNVYIANDLTAVSWQPLTAGEGGGGTDTILGIAAPTAIPARIGQLFINTTENAAYISTGATADDWEQIDSAGIASVDWAEITGKPETFPSTPHSHAIADVTGLEATLAGKADDADLNGKANTVHTHIIGDVTGLTAALDGKADDAHNHDADYADINHNHDTDYAAINHTHTIANVTGLQTALDAKADETDLAGKADINHTHTIANITNLQTTLDAKADEIDVYTKAEVYNKGEIDQMTMGEGGGSPVIVEDNLTSTSTSNALSANQGRILKGQIDGKAAIAHDHDADYAAIAHTHAIADVTNLQTTLDGKAATNHNHDAAYAAINHNHDADYSDINHNHDTDYAAIDHTHTIANVTGLQTALDGKAAIDHNHDAAYAAINHNHDAAYAAINHNHDADYADINHNHDTDYAAIDHTHTIANVTGLQTALDGKADDGHTHAIADTAGLQAALDSKTDDGHTHTKAEITDFAHTHAIADVTNLQTTLDGKQPKATSVTAIPTTTPTHIGQMAIDPTNKNTYIAEGTAAADWKKLVDSYDLSLKADTGHTHTAANITDFGTAVSANIPAEYLTQTEGDARYQATGAAPTAHVHAIADVTNLQTTLDGKQPKAISVTATPTTTPTHAGQMAVDSTNKNTYIAEGTASGDWKKLVDAADLATKSDTSHTHTESTLTFGGTNAKTYVDNADNVIINTKLAGLTLWQGTETAYNNIGTKSATTLYFITGA